ncbi:MAG: PEP-CTERM sorting domain-containing protein, partial [Phycisphaerae bacterium]|nr:PEP-CTERM sorting domain-containing protein [Phycisphaerae bacterium]
DASAGGAVVVGYSNSVNTGLPPNAEAFRWTANDGMIGLGDLPGSGFWSEARGVSADGTVVVGSGRSTAGGAFRWTAETGMVNLGDLPGGTVGGAANAISSDGRVIVGESRSTSGVEGFLWTAETGMVGLGDLPGGSFTSRALAVSADGRFITGVSESAIGDEAFLWSADAGMIGLGYLPGSSEFARGLGVTADGAVVVGGSIDETGALAAFIWRPEHGMRALQEVLVTDYGLDLTGWRLREARGLSDDGRTIVGVGINPQGVSEAWIARIPEPSTAVLLLAVFARCAARRRGALP